MALADNVTLIVGLGNPGAEYANTRHNVGFMFIDYLAKYLNVTTSTNKFHSELTSISINNKKLIIAKPQTFMNNSGVAVSEIARFYKIAERNIIVVYDDMDLKFGQIKMKDSGGSAGHNGVKSIDSHISQGYVKFKIGIDRSPIKGDEANYVLGKINTEQKKILEFIFEKICKNLDYLTNNSYDKFLNQYYLDSRKDGI